MNFTLKEPIFKKEDELVADGNAFDDVDQDLSIPDLLQEILATPLLDRIHSILWLVSKRTSDHINPLHLNIIRNRNVKITENPKLHLVWYYDTVFIKPLPNCLLNHKFWKEHLLPPSKQYQIPNLATSTTETNELSPICKQALGFLRSYAYLIRHSSDLRIAQEAHLLPPTLTFTKFNKFIAPFRSLPDELVSPRFQYGQFRLTRLNWAVRISTLFMAEQPFRWNYQQPFRQTRQYISRFGPPLAFVFGAVSLLLSAMQTSLTAQGANTPKAFSDMSWVFSVMWITFTAALLGSFGIGIVILLMAQLSFAVRTSRKRHKSLDP